MVNGRFNSPLSFLFGKETAKKDLIIALRILRVVQDAYTCSGNFTWLL